MIEFVLIWAALATLASIVLSYLTFSACFERDKARQDLHIERQTSKALEGRVTTLRGDNITLEKTNKSLAEMLGDARREIGRMEAERRAEKLSPPPKPDPNTIVQSVNRDEKTGRFVKKPKPVSCG